ncbi:MAG: 4Fe-4S binding protein [Candidatus Bipolaricaulis sp.]|nr:4Fe-4S binding protein [Candidatus Bipolaricaulis sp.]MDD5647031.1 4Fe-4S binding protein [Candidatus Bipolaricaulis sp.]
MKLGTWRRVSQGAGILLGLFGVTGIGMTHLIFPGLHCYACPWAITVCPIGLMQNMVVYGAFPFFGLGVIVAYGVLAARGFCGWFCPFGTLNDLVSFRKRRIRRVASYGKYAVLLGTLIGAWALADTVFCKLCPAASIEASIPYLVLGVARVNRPFLVHMATLGATLVGMMLVARFWCRYLCPMGGVLSLFNRVSFLHLRLERAKCTECGACAVACPMGIEPHRDHDDHNCIKCGECVGACSAGALSLCCSPRRRP